MDDDLMVFLALRVGLIGVVSGIGRRPETVGQKMDEGDFFGRRIYPLEHGGDRVVVGDNGSLDTVCEVAVRTTKRAGEDLQLFAQIEHVRREGAKCDKQDDVKKSLLFLMRERGAHERLPLCFIQNIIAVSMTLSTFLYTFYIFYTLFYYRITVISV